VKQIFEAMGTIVSLRCPAGSTAAVEQIFSGLEARFSLYREDSEASRMARGELLLKDASTEMRSMYALAHDWRVATDGAFPASQETWEATTSGPRSPGRVARPRWTSDSRETNANADARIFRITPRG